MNYKKKLFIPVFIIALVWGFVINLLIVSFAPYNPLTPSKSFRLELSLLAPQGWAFFTRNAREPNTFVYKKRKDKLVLIDFQKNSSRQNGYGVSRNARLLSVEITELLKQIDTSKWSSSSRASLTNQCNSAKTVEVVNYSVNPILKDTILIESREKIPWAWIKSYDKITMSSKTIKLYVTLPRKNK